VVSEFDLVAHTVRLDAPLMTARRDLATTSRGGLTMTQSITLPSEKEIKGLMRSVRVAYRAMTIAKIGDMSDVPTSALANALDALEFASYRFLTLSDLCADAIPRIKQAAGRRLAPVE
jgi:hypothetical protein